MSSFIYTDEYVRFFPMRIDIPGFFSIESIGQFFSMRIDVSGFTVVKFLELFVVFTIHFKSNHTN